MFNNNSLNKLRSLILILIFFAVIPNLNAQNSLDKNLTISGTVSSAETGEAIIGAYIIVKGSTDGVVTNHYGYYALSLPMGNYTLIYRYMGFNEIEKEIQLKESVRIDVELSETSSEIEAVTVSAEGENKNVSSSETGVTNIDPKDIEIVPVLFGEKDILKTIQLLPGVKTAGEGGSGFYVRGGGTDENLILLDEAPVYNASHLLGFFSVFNSDAVKDMKLYKGTAPAQYGGRLSSVLDITMNEGNTKKYKATGGVGMIASRLMLEGPIVKDKGSFMVSGRRTYADLFLIFAKKKEQRNSTLYFYDFNLKANYKINENNRLYASGYFGRDVFSFNEILNMNWGNATGTVRWNHLFNEKLFLNSTLIYSDYDYKIGFAFKGFGTFWIKSHITDWNWKEDFQVFINSDNVLRFGTNAIHHTFKPGEVDVEGTDEFNDIFVDDKYAVETAAYISHEWKISKNLNLTYGIRYSNFIVLGPGKVYQFNDFQTPVDSVEYDTNEIMQTYAGFEPRANINYTFNPKHSVKASYTRNRQYLHLLQNSTASSPTDVWYPATKQIAPGIADLFSVGYYRNFYDNTYESSFEVYYKDIISTIDFRDGANVMLNQYLEAEILEGTGYSYGAEFYVKKRKGALTGWISYTLSRTMREFAGLNYGNPYPARQDRIHDLAVVGMYQIGKRLSVSATWVFYTGDAVTFPSGRYLVDGYMINLYTERNGYRMPNYHRADVGITLKNKERKRWESSWNLSAYNVYARKNAYDISFRTKESDPSQMEAVRLALFRIVPALTYNFSLK